MVPLIGGVGPPDATHDAASDESCVAAVGFCRYASSGAKVVSKPVNYVSDRFFKSGKVDLRCDKSARVAW